jgi:hypothetical protein
LDIGILKNQPYSFSEIPGKTFVIEKPLSQLASKNLNDALIGKYESVEHMQKRRLTGTVCADNADFLALPYSDIYVT